jgi:multidrug efflux system outer membrane protein
MRTASSLTEKALSLTALTYCIYIKNSRLLALILTPLFVCACTVMPQPSSVADRYQEARNNVAQLFAKDEGPMTLTYEEALARGVRYNFDYRIKLINSALQAGQLKIAEFTMFPDLKTTGSLYTRNNDYATFGITSTGQPTNVLTSTPRTLRSLREGFTWNLLDLGMGYVRARQQGERVLIAEEESRKQLQLLAQDIRIAYWKAYSAQTLLREAHELQKILNKTESNMQAAIADDLIPKDEILKFRNAILGGDRQLIELSQKMDKAIIDLKQLLRLPLDQRLTLKAPPASITRVQNLENLDFKKLDTISLIMRPELASQNYMERIAKLGVKAAILQVFPGITLNQGWNYNSNKFLVNNLWIDKSVDVSWGLLSLVSLPTTIDTAKSQIKYEAMKSMALTLAVMTQTRYATSQYINLAKQYRIASKQTQNAEAIYRLALNRNLASLASKQDVVYAKLQAMIAKMDRDLILADLSTALGELYLSAGFDVLPVDAYALPMNETLRYVKTNFDLQDNRNFVQYVNATYDKLLKQFPTQTIVKKSVEEQPEIEAKIVAENKPKAVVTAAPLSTTIADATTKAIPTTHDNKLYTLQIFGSYNMKEIKKMKTELSKSNKNVYAGCAKFNGRDWYVLTYGTYNSPFQARTSIHELPAQYQTRGAFVRNTQEITWNQCEPKPSKLMTAFKNSFKRNVAVLLIKDYKHYASTAYKKIIDSWTA